MSNLSKFMLYCYAGLACILSLTLQVKAEDLCYSGVNGPGAGRTIVLLAGDHEYRSEETLPALARILSRHYGFKTIVLFSTDPKTGEIAPGSSYMEGLESLAAADLMVNFLRFQNFPDEQMQHIDAYLRRGGPVVGLRTATHAFKMPESATYQNYSYRYDQEPFAGGFGRLVLGESWAGHYGPNHKMSTRLDLIEDQLRHPILCGVNNVWVQSGGYWAEPRSGCVPLAMAQPLNGMQPDSPVAAEKSPCPAVWMTSYEITPEKSGRVFTTTAGASVDLLNDGFRRLLVNGCLWACGLEQKITPDSNIDFVGPYQPSDFAFNGHRGGTYPHQLQAWDSPIPPLTAP